MSSNVNITIPQAITHHIELCVDCGEQPQANAVESSSELVLPGNLSWNDSIDIRYAQTEPSPDVDQGDLCPEQSDLDDNVPLDTDVTVTGFTEYAWLLNFKKKKISCVMKRISFARKMICCLKETKNCIK